MFGLMEIQELLNSYNALYPDVEYSIVPTILLPLAFLSTGISVVATFVAGLFGIKLKAEGPKKLLELLLRPKILISALLLNALIYGGLVGYNYIKNGPVPFFVMNFKNSDTSFIKNSYKGSDFNWGNKVDGGIFAKGVIVGNELIFGTSKGYMYIVDKESGNFKERVFFGKFLSPTPVLFKDKLYFGEGLHASHHMRLYKYDPAMRKIESVFNTKGHTEIFPVVSNIEGKDLIFQTAGEDGVYAIDPLSMEKVWQFKDGHMDSFVKVEGKDLYVSSGLPLEDIGKRRPYAYKINALTGKLIWKKELPLSAWYGPVIIKDKVCFIQGEIHVPSKVGGISCLYKNGKRFKSIELDFPVISKPIVHNDDLIFNDFRGNLYAWNLNTDLLRWEIRGKSKSYSYTSVTSVNDNFFVYANPNGKIQVIEKLNGRIHKEFKFIDGEKVFADPLVVRDGFYIFGMKGNIKFYKFEI